MRKVLIADASEHWREMLEQALRQEYQVRSCADGQQAMELADRFRPDVLVLDLMLVGTDGLGVLKHLSGRPGYPRVIVTSRYFSNFITATLEQYQVDSVMMKPCSTHSILERVDEVLAAQDGPEIPICQDPLDYITALLVRLGAPTSQQGFRYLRRGILLLMEDPGQQLTKSLYPTIAAEFSTSTANVEKALRTTVTTAWSKRRDEVWRLYFPLAPGGQIPKPTAGQFLIRLADAVQSAVRKQA